LFESALYSVWACLQRTKAVFLSPHSSAISERKIDSSMEGISNLFASAVCSHFFVVSWRFQNRMPSHYTGVCFDRVPIFDLKVQVLYRLA